MAMIFKAMGLLFALFMLSMCVGMCGTTSKAPTPGTIVAIDSKMEETCKDWLYSRNRIIKLNKEGNQAGAEKARQAMKAFQKDLDAYPEQQVAETIDRLEKSGYRAGL